MNAEDIYEANIGDIVIHKQNKTEHVLSAIRTLGPNEFLVAVSRLTGWYDSGMFDLKTKCNHLIGLVQIGQRYRTLYVNSKIDYEDEVCCSLMLPSYEECNLFKTQPDHRPENCQKCNYNEYGDIVFFKYCPDCGRKIRYPK
jgi:hypothetical protein